MFNYYDEEESEPTQAHNKFWQEKSFGNYIGAYPDAVQKEMEEAMSDVLAPAKGPAITSLKDIVGPSGSSYHLVNKPSIDSFDAFGYTWGKYNINTNTETIEDKWMKERLQEMGFLVDTDITPEQWEEAYRKLLGNEHN